MFYTNIEPNVDTKLRKFAENQGFANVMLMAIFEQQTERDEVRK